MTPEILYTYFTVLLHMKCNPAHTVKCQRTAPLVETVSDLKTVENLLACEVWCFQADPLMLSRKKKKKKASDFLWQIILER